MISYNLARPCEIKKNTMLWFRNSIYKPIMLKVFILRNILFAAIDQNIVNGLGLSDVHF